MLERLQTIAKLFSRLKWLLIMVALAGLIGFGLSLFESQVLEGYQLMMPSLVALFWATAGLCFAVLFDNIPPLANPDAGYRQRWSTALRRGGYWLLGSLMILLSLSLVVLSYQLIRTWFML
ncbi:MAG: hypothetical protein ACI945_000451 [Pseudohongiellaceae bacterium]|jgi:hypothetical protein